MSGHTDLAFVLWTRNLFAFPGPANALEAGALLFCSSALTERGRSTHKELYPRIEKVCLQYPGA